MGEEAIGEAPRKQRKEAREAAGGGRTVTSGVRRARPVRRQGREAQACLGVGIPTTTTRAADRGICRREASPAERERDRAPVTRGELDQGDKRDRFDETRRAVVREGACRVKTDTEGVYVYAERVEASSGRPFSHDENGTSG